MIEDANISEYQDKGISYSFPKTFPDYRFLCYFVCQHFMSQQSEKLGHRSCFDFIGECITCFFVFNIEENGCCFTQIKNIKCKSKSNFNCPVYLFV